MAKSKHTYLILEDEDSLTLINTNTIVANAWTVLDSKIVAVLNTNSYIKARRMLEDYINKNTTE